MIWDIVKSKDREMIKKPTNNFASTWIKSNSMYMKAVYYGPTGNIGYTTGHNNMKKKNSQIC